MPCAYPPLPSLGFVVTPPAFPAPALLVEVPSLPSLPGVPSAPSLGFVVTPPAFPAPALLVEVPGLFCPIP